MDFSFTADQKMLREHVSHLLDEVCPPEYAESCDNNAQPPRDAYLALANQGWFGLILPPEFGGTGGSAIDLAIMLEEIGRHFEELECGFFVTLTYGGYAVMTHGTPEQKATLLPKILRGEISFCFGLTEPVPVRMRLRSRLGQRPWMAASLSMARKYLHPEWILATTAYW